MSITDKQVHKLAEYGALQCPCCNALVLLNGYNDILNREQHRVLGNAIMRKGLFLVPLEDAIENLKVLKNRPGTRNNLSERMRQLEENDIP
jgi:hypothetical protein